MQKKMRKERVGTSRFMGMGEGVGTEERQQRRAPATFRFHGLLWTPFLS